MENKIPNNINHFLYEIADRLWNGHASIMIGAGFSRNAKKTSSNPNPFPTWNELGDIFYEKLHSRKPNESDKSYLNVLKLADEIEVTFGKEYLNNLIKRVIPDNEYIPSDLHIKMLSLPWKDVFTTNYDTLLERSADLIVDKRYEIVTNKHDLVWSTSPRIVKLHGSFPSERPFIISEEDYRQYPQKYAPFVNTVQQSLLENTLCLVGFSGDDPNFLNWIGWIRDNLGKENSPKIYLIGVLSLSTGQIKLLEERNIIPIDLSGYCSDKINHYEAIDKFIDSINGLNSTKAEEWGQKDFEYNQKSDNIMEVFEGWKKLRQSYPGWLILPNEKRKRLIDTTNSVCLSKNLLAKFSDPNDLLFLFEFNWRIEKGLHPLLNDWDSIYESTIEKYNPFHQKLEIKGAITSNVNNKLDWDQIKNAWIILHLSLMRLYREEGWNDKWQFLSNRLGKVIYELSSEQQARYYYEQCLQHAYNFDLIKIKECIDKWPVDMSMPYWEAKRASLIAEFDSTKEAVNILELALKEIRSRLNLSQTKNNYGLISMESYIMLLHRSVSRGDEIRQRSYRFETNDSYQQRWQDLKQYDCNPWEELKDFRLRMQSVLDIPKNQERIPSFDIGYSSTTYRFGSNKSFRLAWGYFRFIEEVGLPYQLPHIEILDKECFNNAITIIAQYSPFSGNVAMIRSGRNETVNSIYNRASLSKMSSKTVSDYILRYAELLKYTYNINKNQEELYNLTKSLAATLPEVISRLCCKATYESRITILDIVKDIFILNKVESYTHIDSLIKRLINSFSEKEQYNLIPKLLEFPIYSGPKENDNYDPFRYISISNKLSGITIDKEIINELLSTLTKNDHSRAIAYYRLYVLFRYKLLNNIQIKKMAKNSWSQIDNDGFPLNLYFYDFAFLELPHLDNIDPVSVLRRYIANTPFPINSNEKGNAIGFYRGDIPLFKNIAGTYEYRDKYKWSSLEINKLCSDIIEWWNIDKHYLLNNDNYWGLSPSEEFKSRFKLIVEIITSVLSDNYSIIDQSYITKIKEMVDEIPNYDVYNLNIKASLLPIYDNNESLKKEIIIAISSNEEDQILDGVNAIIELLETNKDISDLSNAITSNFRCGKKEGLKYCIGCTIQILSNKKNVLSSKDIQNIELGLLYLLSYTQIKNDDTESDINHKIDIKRKVAKLLVYYKMLVSTSDACVKWEKIVSDENEFLEISNQYRNTMYNCM